MSSERFERLNTKSQAQEFGAIHAKVSWEEWERQTLGTFLGGYHDGEKLEAFQHGIRTVFRMMKNEMPPLQDLRDLAQALEAQRKENEPCIWTYQDHFGYHETSCDADWQFVDGGMKDNGVHYCMNCGRPALEAALEQEDGRE